MSAYSDDMWLLGKNTLVPCELFFKASCGEDPFRRESPAEAVFLAIVNCSSLPRTTSALFRRRAHCNSLSANSPEPPGHRPKSLVRPSSHMNKSSWRR